MDHFEGDGSAMSWTSEDGGTRTFHKRVIVTEAADGDEGEANVMILRNKVAVDSNGVAIADADGETHISGHDVVMARRRAPEGQGFAFTTGDGPLPAIALPLEATIHRLESSAKFQELDAATRAKVLEALRESAPTPGTFVREAGGRTIVLEMQDEADGEN
jgi:hypothetical protein